MYQDKYLKYKLKYDNIIQNDFNETYNSLNNKIDYCLNNVLNQSGGGTNNNKINKYKIMMKNAKDTIYHYKNIINQYQMSNMALNSKYVKLYNILQNKKTELENINSKLGVLDGNNKHNKEKIQLLESALQLLKHNSLDNIDFNVKVNIENDGKSVAHNEKIKLLEKRGGSLFYNNTLQGGGPSDDEVMTLEQAIKQMDDSVAKLNDSQEVDKKKLEKLVEEFDKENKKIKENVEKLKEVDVFIDFSIKSLEELSVSEANFKDLMKHFAEKMKEIEKNKMDFSPLEEKIKYLKLLHNKIDEFIKLYNISKEGLPEEQRIKFEEFQKLMDDEMSNTGNKKYNKLINKQYGGNNIISGKRIIREDYEMYGGNSFKKIKDMIHYSVDDKYHTDDNIAVLQLIYKLDNIIKLLNGLKNVLPIQILDKLFLIQSFKDIYHYKKTKYYDKLVDLEIYDLTDFDKIIKFGNFLDKMNLPGTTKVPIDITSTNTGPEKYKKINNTVISLYHLARILLNIYITLIESSSETTTEDVLLLQQKLSHVSKSMIFNTMESDENFKQNGGMPFFIRGVEFDLDTQTQTHFKKIEIEENTETAMKIYLSHTLRQLGSEYKKHIKYKHNPKQIMIQSAKQMIPDIYSIMQNIEALYLLINSKLGRKNTKPISDAKLLDFLEICSLEELMNELKDVKETGQDGNEEGKTEDTLSEIESKQLKQYYEKLSDCEKKFRPYFLKNNILLKMLKSYDIDELIDSNELKFLFEIYSELVDNHNKGTQSFINTTPYIILSTEKAYSSSQYCYFKSTFDKGKSLVSWSPVNCSKQQELKVSAHYGFFQSDEKITTKAIYDDPILGIDKIQGTGNIDRQPINMVSYMLFAVGASGTGKTYRFTGGKEDGNPDDKDGIITRTIKKNTNERNKISFAYSVCYGRKHEGNNDFDEVLLFLNHDKLLIRKAGVNDKYISFIQDVKPFETISYTDFYVNVVNKKLKKINFQDLVEFICEGDVFNSEMKAINGTTSRTYREILLHDESIWCNVEDADNFGDILKTLLKEQKKLKTVLPTKNNIESSRGHTCIIIKIVKHDGSVEFITFFDMAGTEDTEAMREFLTQSRDTEKMSKVILKLSEITQESRIMEDDEMGEYQSLEKILSDERIKAYVSVQEQGGGNSIKLSNINNSDFESQTIPDGTQFLNKIINEGHYINHTIAMFLLISSLNAASLKAKTDEFDNILNAGLIEKLLETVSNISSREKKLTHLLLNDISYNEILSKSCIWAQILLSFTYWNKETDSSMVELIKEFQKYINSEEKFDKLPYLIGHCSEEPIYGNIHSFDELLGINYNSVNDIVEKIIEVNLTINIKDGSKILTFNEGRIINPSSPKTEGKTDDICTLIQEFQKTIDNAFEIKSDGTSKIKINSYMTRELFNLLIDRNLEIKYKATDKSSYTGLVAKTPKIDNTTPIGKLINFLEGKSKILCRKINIDLKLLNRPTKEGKKLGNSESKYIFNNSGKGGQNSVFNYDVEPMHKSDTKVITNTQINNGLAYLEKFIGEINDHIIDNTISIEVEDLTIDNLEIYTGQQIQKIYEMPGYQDFANLFPDGLIIDNMNILIGNTNLTIIIQKLGQLTESQQLLSDERKQMLRVKEGHVTAAKNIILLLLSSEAFKYDMIKETTTFTQQLYDLTDISF